MEAKSFLGSAFFFERMALNLKRQKSMRKSFLLLCTVIILIIIASFAINIIVMHNVFIQNTSKLVLMAHTQTSENITNYLTGIENIAFSMCYSPSMQQFLKEPNPAMRIALFREVQAVYSNVVYLNSAIMGFSIYDRDGLFITANGNSFQVITQRDKIDMTTYIRYDSLYPPNPYIGNTISCYTLTIPIIETGAKKLSKSILGTVVFTINLAEVNKQIQASNLYEGSYMTLYSETEKALASAGASFAPSEAGHNPIAYDTTIGQTGWKLVTGFESGILADDIKGVWLITIISGVMIVIFISFFFLLLLKRIVSPIEGISRFMQSVSEEPTNIVYRSHSDTYAELSTMTASMNVMLQSLSEKNIAIIEQDKKVYEAVLEAKRLEILAYRSQINPHFLYNTLDCISGMALRYNAPEIEQISQALSGMFRYAIKGRDFVTIGEELTHMQEYATIIHHRFMGRIAIHLNATDEAKALLIPRLVLQPVVENAVFHGLEKKIGPGEIQVDVYAQDGLVHMRVADNGLGMPPESAAAIMKSMTAPGASDNETQEEQGGVGLLNIVRRLRIFYGGKASLQIESRLGEGTTVSIVLPLDQEGR